MPDPDIPDPYTYQDWHQQMIGVKHLIALAAAEYVEADQRILELKERVEALETALEDAQATIGKMREAYKELRNGS